MDGFRRRPDEELVELVVAVVRVVGHFDFGGIFGERAEAVAGFGELVVETAADFAGPADADDTFACVKSDAGFFTFQTLGVGDVIGIDIIQPGAQREFDLREAHAFAQEHTAVNVDFGFHCR